MSNIDLERHVDFRRGNYPTEVTVTHWEASDAEESVGGQIIRVQNIYEDPTQVSLDRLEDVLGLTSAYRRPQNVRLEAMVFQSHITVSAVVKGALD